MNMLRILYKKSINFINKFHVVYSANTIYGEKSHPRNKKHVYTEIIVVVPANVM